MVKQAIKFTSIILLIAFYLVHASLICLAVRDHWQRKRKLVRLISSYCTRALKILDVQVNVDTAAPLPEKSYLFVGNHLSYLDVLVIAHKVSGCFVTSQEIRETPVLGHICELGGCLFVERRNKSNLTKEIRQVSDALAQGLNVVIFPEATSTNGEQVLRFRRPLFMAARMANTPVLPFCLNYESIDGVPFHLGNRDRICWYGDMAFVPHLWSLAGAQSVIVRLHFLEAIYPKAEQEIAEIADLSHSLVKKTFRPVAQL